MEGRIISVPLAYLISGGMGRAIVYFGIPPELKVRKQRPKSLGQPLPKNSTYPQKNVLDRKRYLLSKLLFFLYFR